MITVHKYTVDTTGRFVISEAVCREVLVAVQFDTDVFPTLWLEVDTEALAPRDTTYVIVGTGHRVPDGATHVGSAKTIDGAFVWHVYRLGEETPS